MGVSESYIKLLFCLLDRVLWTVITFMPVEFSVIPAVFGGFLKMSLSPEIAILLFIIFFLRIRGGKLLGTKPRAFCGLDQPSVTKQYLQSIE